MNKNIKTILSWSTAKQLLILMGVLTLTSEAAFSNPTGGAASSGTSISSSGNTLTVNQGTNQAIINWQTFNIANGEKTQFVQPNSSSIALNRVNPANGVSGIYGSLTANGRLILINQAGIYFGPNSHVDVAGLMASTSDISDKNFLSGNFVFDRPSPFPNASITNEGTIRTANYGLVALMGQQVRNDGTIQARLGTVALGAGNKFTLDFDGDQLVNFVVNSPSKHANVTNTGSLVADGGTIIVSARAARGVVDNVINMGGVAQARSVGTHNGEIILGGGRYGTVNVTGKLIASGHHSSRHLARNSQSLKGGSVHISGNDINLASSALIDVSGDNGGGSVLIGGDSHGANMVNSINGGPSKVMANANTLEMNPGAVINADATVNGNGGKVVLWSQDDTQFLGSLSAKGGAQGGNGGSIETSGNYLGAIGGLVNTSAPNGTKGTWLIDPADLTICATGSCGSPAANDTATPNTFVPSSNDSFLDVATLEGALMNNDVIVSTVGATGGTGSGDINVNTAISWTPNTPTSLTLNAARNININANIIGSQDNGISVNSAVTDSTGVTNIASGITIQTDGNQSYTGPISLGGNVSLTSTGGSVSADTSGITNTAASVLTVTNATTGTFAGNITDGTGTATSLVKAGAGTLTLTGANTYSGTTEVSDGILLISGSSATAGTGTITVDASKELQLNGSNLSNNLTLDNGSNLTDIGTLSGATYSGPITLNGTPSINSEDFNAFGFVVSGQISGGTSLNINNNSDTGLVTFHNEMTSNTYGPSAGTKGTEIMNGHLNLGNGNDASTGDIYVDSGAGLVLYNYGAGDVTIANNLYLANNSGLYSQHGNNAVSGTINLPLTGTTQEVIAAQTANSNLTISGQITSGSVSNNLNFASTGPIFVTDANNYAGTTSISSGQLIASDSTALSTGAVTVDNASSLVVNDSTIANNIILNGAGAAGTNGALVGTGTAEADGSVTLASDSSIGANTSSTLALTGAISGNYGLTLNGPGTISLDNSGTGTGGVNVGSLVSNAQLNIETSFLGTYTIQTAGNQIYNNPINLDPSGNSFTSYNFNTGTGNISINSGVSDVAGVGALNLLTLSGTGNNAFSLNGQISVGSGVNISGSGNGNTLSLNTFDSSNNSQAQTWNITSANTGNTNVNLSGGGFTFSGIQNLFGGSNADNFIFGSGTTTASLNNIDGGVSNGGMADTFDVSALANPVNVTLTGNGTYHGVAGTADFTFNDIDLFILNPGSTVTNNIPVPLGSNINNGNFGNGFSFNGDISSIIGEIYNLYDDKLYFYDDGQHNVTLHKKVHKVGFSPVKNNSFNINGAGTVTVTESFN